MAGEREHLRDAVAHEAGADDGDFCVMHPTVSRFPDTLQHGVMRR
jgi:hypothetical protein